MSSDTDDFADSIERDLAQVEQEYTSGVRLRVAVLGPDLANVDDPGSYKRQQIYDEIKSEGHSPFFPEEYVQKTNDLTWLVQERVIIERDDVDLVIVLDTSAGPLVEIASFADVPNIVNKTAVLVPDEYYVGDSLPGNVIRSYFARWKYTQQDLEACHVVAECLAWVHNRLLGTWPTMVSYKD